MGKITDNIKKEEINMDYKEALEFIQSTKTFGSKLGLERIEQLVDRLGNPEKKLQIIHVAGTNGKGSTIAFMSSVLCQAGYKVGIYTSPGLYNFNDRIRINQKEIDDESVGRIIGEIKEKIKEMLAEGYEHPTEFEIMTALALVYFAEQNCNLVILEVGLGGKLDSTNVIKAPMLSVITPIDYDHMDILGDTIEEIAKEKAGILKRGTRLVMSPQREEAEVVILKRAERLDIPVHKVDYSDIQPISWDTNTQCFSVDQEEYKTSILGFHQLQNALVAIEALYALETLGVRVPQDALKKGLVMARWPARFEILDKDPLVVIDGAHNLQGVKILKENLKSYFGEKEIIFIMGVMKDKNYKEMIEELKPIMHKVYTVTPNNSRALSAVELQKALEEEGVNSKACLGITSALEASLNEVGENQIICAFGSLYFMGELRESYLSLEEKS